MFQISSILYLFFHFIYFCFFLFFDLICYYCRRGLINIYKRCARDVLQRFSFIYICLPPLLLLLPFIWSWPAVPACWNDYRYVPLQWPHNLHRQLPVCPSGLLFSLCRGKKYLLRCNHSAHRYAWFFGNTPLCFYFLSLNFPPTMGFQTVKLL